MSYIYDYQPAKNGKYWTLADIAINGLVLHSIGCPQPKAQVLVNNFNKSTAKASVHGFIEPGKYIETAPTRNAKRKAKKCYHIGGNWNSSRIGIEMCEPSTIAYTGGASFRDNNPAKTKEYIEGATATAVEVFADLCIFHSIPVEMVSTHAQAHKSGNGSNHGDPEHLWRHIGYSLDQFRKDIQKTINEKKGDVLANMTTAEFNKILDERLAAVTPATYKYFEDVPDWAKPAIKKCIDNGYLTGTGSDAKGTILNLSADLTRTLVILNAAGVFAAPEAAEGKK